MSPMRTLAVSTIFGLWAVSTAAATLSQPHPNAIFTAVIYGDHRQKFGTPEISLRGKRIGVTGQMLGT